LERQKEAPRRKPGDIPRRLAVTPERPACGRIIPLLAHGGFYAQGAFMRTGLGYPRLPGESLAGKVERFPARAAASDFRFARARAYPFGVSPLR